MINVMILSAKLPLNLWRYALLTACHVHNRIHSKKIKVSPYELWNGRKPNLDFIKVWGCLAFYRVVDPKRTKLGPRVMKSVFVGYAENSKAYRLLDLNSNIVLESRDVVFIEDIFSKDSINALILTQIQQSESNPNTTLGGTKRIESGLPSEQRKSQRIRKVKGFGLDFISYQAQLYLIKDNRQVVLNKIHIVFNTKDDPKTFEEAMASRDSSLWKEVVNDGIDSILSNNFWVAVDVPTGSKPIGCK